MKKSKEKAPKKIDYCSIIEEMSEKAFAFCVANVYPVYNYRILKESDIRRIDIEENLLRISRILPMEMMKSGVMNVYLNNLKSTVFDYMNIAPNTREQRLMSRFEMAVEKALSEDGTVQDIDDAFVCFITLFHSPICRIDEKLKSQNDCLSLKINKDDIEILKHLKKKKSKDADGPLAMIKDKLPIGNEKPDIRKFMYINNVVFLSRALQYYGGLGEEKL